MSQSNETHTSEQARQVRDALVYRLGNVVLSGDTRRLASTYLNADQVPTNIMSRLMEAMDIVSPPGHWLFSAQAELVVGPDKKPLLAGRVGSITFRVFHEPGPDDDGPSKRIDYEVFGTNDAQYHLRRTTTIDENDQATRDRYHGTPYDEGDEKDKYNSKLEAVLAIQKRVQEARTLEDLTGMSMVTQGEATQLPLFINHFPDPYTRERP